MEYILFFAIACFVLAAIAHSTRPRISAVPTRGKAYSEQETLKARKNWEESLRKQKEVELKEYSARPEAEPEESEYMPLIEHVQNAINGTVLTARLPLDYRMHAYNYLNHRAGNVILDAMIKHIDDLTELGMLTRTEREKDANRYCNISDGVQRRLHRKELLEYTVKAKIKSIEYGYVKDEVASYITNRKETILRKYWISLDLRPFDVNKIETDLIYLGFRISHIKNILRMRDHQAEIFSWETENSVDKIDENLRECDTVEATIALSIPDYVYISDVDDMSDIDVHIKKVTLVECGCSHAGCCNKGGSK